VRGLVLAAFIFAVALLAPACVQDESLSYTRTPPPPVYHPLPPREYVPSAGKVRAPVSRRVLPRRHHPEWYPEGRRISSRWTTIVIHHSATDGGGAKRFDQYHRKSNGWDELGYHFVIGNGTDTPDGYVEVGSRWHKQKHGAHCRTNGNYHNEHGIGICLVGHFNHARPTPRQMASLRELVSFLSATCDIPVGRVTTHKAVNPKTQCPGRNFNLSGLQRSLRPGAGV